jgi:hypothetical protein
VQESLEIHVIASGRKVKVCMVTTAHPALDTRIHFREAVSLAAYGYTVSTIGNHHRPETIDQVRIIPLPPRPGRLKRIFLWPWVAVRLALRTKAEIFHLHDPELLLVGIALRLLGKKIVYDSHEDYSGLILVKDWIPHFLKSPLAWGVGFLERTGAALFQLNIAPTDPLARRFPRGISLYNYPTEEIRNLLMNAQQPYGKRDIDLIHVGVLRQVRLEFLLRVLVAVRASLPGIQVALIGLTKEQIATARSSMGKDSRWVLEERLPFREVAPYLGRSKLALNYHPLEPHLRYAVPVKIFEYLGAGCVTICSHFPFLESLLGVDCPVVWVKPDPAKFACEIISLLRDPLRGHDLSERSTACSARFGWECEEGKLLDAYRGLA